MIGIEPVDLTPYHFFEAPHPDDIKLRARAMSL
jgi:hypothetical protein